MGVADGQAQVVSRADEIAYLSFEPIEKLGVVVQTTFNITTMQEIIQHFPTLDVVVRKTICPDVMGKQNEVRELAGKVDAIVVAGSKLSSNTTRLFEIAREVCPKTYFVHRAVELDKVELNGVNTIAVTGGASTPDWIIGEVIEYLNHLSLQEQIFARNSTTSYLKSAVY
jgi:4-hydroxy-3-methylbut-2-enyl diphosphate reductase